MYLFADIEDLDNWHGKPIPKDRVDDLLKDLQALIQVPNKTLSPEMPKDDTAPADLSTISLPEPPAYKKGDKVPESSLTSATLTMSLTGHWVGVASCSVVLPTPGMFSF